MRVLLVEDEQKIAGFIARGLGEEGHRVDVAEDLASARRLLAGSAFDVLIVDRMLPDGDGLTLVKERRVAGDRTPTICVTARDRVGERVEGLLGGADDYLVKPFAFEELLARITAIARRATLPPTGICVGDLVVDVERHRVTRGGREITLTAQEFLLLQCLAEHAGTVMTRARLLALVWQTFHDPGTNVVDVYIGYLRRKIDGPGEAPLLRTVRGVGYVLEEQGDGGRA